jgi:hypothetical protein
MGQVATFSRTEESMPETHKYATESPLQGYPDVNAKPSTGVLKNDLKLLLDIYADDTAANNPDAIKKLEVGRVCGELRPKIRKKMIDLCATEAGSVYKLIDNYGKWREKPPENVKRDAKEVELGDITFMMGPLKKVPRIFQKSVSYAVCTDKPTAEPKLARVVDILRATMIFENEEFFLFKPDDGKACIGSQLIDLFNKEFGGQLVQVKNRFMNRRQPQLHSFTTQNFAKALNVPMNHTIIEDDEEDLEREEVTNANLVNTIATMVNLELSSRDTFYRDLQLLIKLPTDKYSVQSPMKHVYFELQMTTRALFNSKTVETNGRTGHQIYNQIRGVTEYCEYLYWTWKRQNGKDKDKLAQVELDQKLIDAVFYTPHMDDFASFEKDLTAMWEQYSLKAPKGKKLDAIRNAIDESDWYKNSK